MHPMVTDGVQRKEIIITRCIFIREICRVNFLSYSNHNVAWSLYNSKDWKKYYCRITPRIVKRVRCLKQIDEKPAFMYKYKIINHQWNTIGRYVRRLFTTSFRNVHLLPFEKDHHSGLRLYYICILIYKFIFKILFVNI